MNFNLKRTIIVSVEDACNNLMTVKNIVLHSLLVSHGIRVDTILYILDLSRNIVYSLNGYELRHLYAQEKSLIGFINSLFCKGKLFVGTNIYPESILFMDADKYDLVLTVKDEVFLRRKQYLWIPLPSVPSSILIIDNASMKHLSPIIQSTILAIESTDAASFIVFSHYLIDKTYGGWIRRYGKIEYREPVR